MLFLDLLFVFVIAVLMTAIFGLGDRRARWGSDVVPLFMILLVATWAGGIWLIPFGPTLWNVSWLPFLIVGLIVALLLLAVIPRSDRRVIEVERQQREPDPSSVPLGAFFWIILMVLIAAIVIGYLQRTA